MSGEVKTKKKFANGKAKKAEVAEDSGISVTAVKGKTAGAGASLCTKFLFFVLLASLALTFSLFVLDYQQGQLQEFRSQLPLEVRDVLDKAAKVSGDLSAQVRQSYNRALVKIETLSSHVPVGDKTLADILFGDKKKVPSSPSLIQKAEAEAKLEAEDKANKVEMAELEEKERVERAKLEEKERVEKEKKRLAVEAEKFSAEKEKMRLAAEAENERLAAEEERRKTEEEAARKAAELEAFKKAEAEAARLEKEFSEKQAAERRKRVEAEAIRKAEEELAEKIRAEKLNAEIEKKHRQAQEEAEKKFQEAKKKLEETGAEFVSQEEFSKIESQKKSASADAA